MSGFPIHLVSMLRMCGAITIPGLGAGTNVFINNLIPALEGDKDNHMNLGALINMLSHNVNIGPSMIPAIPSLISMASPDVVGLMTHPGGLPIPAQGSPNVFIGQGAGGAGIGLMQRLLGGGFGSLSIGELVSVAGQVVGTVQNFTSIGGGAGVAQLSNLQGSLQSNQFIGPGTTITGQTSGYNFTFQNYFDSRALTNVVDSPYYTSANSYPSVETVSNALVTDSGEYIVIQDYYDFPGLSNLTVSVITT
jgi:hypothetical protein